MSKLGLFIFIFGSIGLTILIWFSASIMKYLSDKQFEIIKSKISDFWSLRASFGKLEKRRKSILSKKEFNDIKSQFSNNVIETLENEDFLSDEIKQCDFIIEDIVSDIKSRNFLNINNYKTNASHLVWLSQAKQDYDKYFDMLHHVEIQMKQPKRVIIKPSYENTIPEYDTKLTEEELEIIKTAFL